MDNLRSKKNKIQNIIDINQTIENSINDQLKQNTIIIDNINNIAPFGESINDINDVFVIKDFDGNVIDSENPWITLKVGDSFGTVEEGNLEIHSLFQQWTVTFEIFNTLFLPHVKTDVIVKGPNIKNFGTQEDALIEISRNETIQLFDIPDNQNLSENIKKAVFTISLSLNDLNNDRIEGDLQAKLILNLINLSNSR